MTETKYDVQGNPIVRVESEADETFTPDEMAAIQTCADNIESIVAVATNGPTWTAQGEAAASRAESAAANAESANTAAQAASTAASTSASAAATSELNAVNAATAADSSADAAAASAAAAADSATENLENPALVPSDGNEGDTLYRAAVGAPYYGNWGPTLQFLKQLLDVDDADPQEGDRLTFLSGRWVGSPASSATRYDALEDTNIVNPLDGQVGIFRTADQKWHNEAFPAGGGGSQYIARNPDLVGPTTYTIRDIDLNGFRKCNVSGGHVDLVWDDQVPIPAGQRGVGYFKLTGANGTNKVRFNAGASSGTAPGTFGVPIHKGLQGSATGNPILNADNVPQNGVIAQGLKCTLAIVYCWGGSGSTSDEVDSPGFIWNGVTGDPEIWQYKELAIGNMMKIAMSYIYLGDIGVSGFPFTWLPQWVDYGGHGRVNAYNVAFIPYYGGDSALLGTAPATIFTSGVAAIDPVKTLSPTDINHEVCYVVGRRNNTAALGTIGITGATQVFERSSGAVQLAGGVRMCCGREAGVANSNNTCHAATVGGTGNSPWISYAFSFIPATQQITLFSRANKAKEMVDANQMMAFMLDTEQKVVDLVY